MRVEHSLAGHDELFGQVAVRVENAYGRDRTVRHPTLPPGFAEELVHLEDRRRVIRFVRKDRCTAIRHVLTPR